MFQYSYTVMRQYIATFNFQLTLTKVIGIVPLSPLLFSARYQKTTLQGSMMVRTSP